MRETEVTYRVCEFSLNVASTSMPEFIDITDRVADSVYDSQIRSGVAVIFSRHTTAAITIQENEPLLINDLSSLLEKLAPRNARYGHNDFSIRTVHMHEDECPNGHSHCQHLVLGSSETIPVIDGRLALGQYQHIFMVELDDDKKEDREILVQVMGV